MDDWPQSSRTAAIPPLPVNSPSRPPIRPTSNSTDFVFTNIFTTCVNVFFLKRRSRHFGIPRPVYVFGIVWRLKGDDEDWARSYHRLSPLISTTQKVRWRWQRRWWGRYSRLSGLQRYSRLNTFLVCRLNSDRRSGGLLGWNVASLKWDWWFAFVCEMLIFGVAGGLWVFKSLLWAGVPIMERTVGL